MFEIYANRPSLIPEKNDDDEELEQEESVRENLIIEHRDGSWKLFARICSTLSVFCYQAAMFYAQLILAQYVFECNAKGVCVMNPIVGNRSTWLVMEMACFYLYLIATMFYIIWRALASACFETGGEKGSDMYKALTDFISYSAINLTWFAINFVMVTMPLLSILLLQGDDMVNPEASGSYEPLIWILWGMHMVAFGLQRRIYEPSKESAESAQDYLDTNFDRDDAFQLGNSLGVDSVHDHQKITRKN